MFGVHAAKNIARRSDKITYLLHLFTSQNKRNILMREFYNHIVNTCLIKGIYRTTYELIAQRSMTFHYVDHWIFLLISFDKALIWLTNAPSCAF
ncbi:Uncharacterised protein [Klebsiella pneumoniae]|nr:Uncharacterised protein [Klebsiella pneumoniae]